jgi:hypothetical protein
MATTSDAPVGKVWECWWSRPGYRVAGVPENFQPETAWVCMRRGERRCISEEECERCAHWERIPDRAF